VKGKHENRGGRRSREPVNRKRRDDSETPAYHVLEHLESQAVINEIDDSSDKEEFVEYRAIKSL